MFLFSKKTRNVIKYAWAVFAVLIILSMVIAYSGFVSLATTPAPQPTPIEIPDEALAELEQQSTTEVLIDDATTTEAIAPADTPAEPAAPPVPELDFSI
jgi:hypothetical protein